MFRLTTLLAATAMMLALAAFGGGHLVVAPAVQLADGPDIPPDPPPCWPFTCTSETEQALMLLADGPDIPPDPPPCWPFTCTTETEQSLMLLADGPDIPPDPPPCWPFTCTTETEQGLMATAFAPASPIALAPSPGTLVTFQKEEV
jgi:hypothetical protein